MDDAAIVAPDELALSEEAFDHLGLPKGQWVTVDHAQPPASMDAVRRKIAGQRLDQRDFRAIIQDITESRYSKTEISAFLVASGQTDMDRDEVLYLTQAMLDSGERLDWDESLVADKHCIGARHAHSQNIQSCHNFARRHRRHHGSAGQCGAGYWQIA